MAHLRQCARLANRALHSNVLGFKGSPLLPTIPCQPPRSYLLSRLFASKTGFAESHEWMKVEDGVGTVGITDFAQNSLGEIVYVEVQPKIGETLDKGDPIAAIESVKAASDIYTPMSGEVIGANADTLDDSPDIVNDSPFDEGWIVKIKLSDESEFDGLMDEAAYEAFCKEQED